MDFVSPLGCKLIKPWLELTIHAIMVLLDFLRAQLTEYQKAVKAAKTQYLSTLVSNNCHMPCVLFNTINSVVDSPVSTSYKWPAGSCNTFLQF